MKKDGFTLLELVVVIIVLGTMASLAIPRVTGSIERTRANEGIQILTAVYNAQQLYSQQNNGAWAPTYNDLGITISSPSYFRPETWGGVRYWGNPPWFVQIRTSGGYIMRIDQNGIITCQNGTGSGPQCADAGY